MKDRLSIGFFGGGPQALECLDRLTGSDFVEVVFVHPRNSEDVSLREFCVKHDIDILEERDANSPDVVEQIRDYAVDLFVSVNARQIFRRPLLDVPPRGAINVHNGMLPRQRGGGGAYTAIVNGESLGTTVHFIDEGIDTGDIVAQRPVELGPEETMGDFQRKAIAVSAEILLDSVKAIRTGTVTRTPQRDAPFHYTPRKAPWDELVDWSQSARMILDKVRARTPGPANFYVHGDELFEIVEASPEPDLLTFTNTVGQVLQRDPDRGVLVKTGDSGIWVRRARRKGEGNDFVPNHPPGAMLRYMLDREIYELKARVAELATKLGERG